MFFAFCIMICLFSVVGVIVSVLASSSVVLLIGSNQRLYYIIGICCFSAKHAALRRKAMIGWLGIRIMCPSRATCLSADYCFSELAL